MNLANLYVEGICPVAFFTRLLETIFLDWCVIPLNMVLNIYMDVIPVVLSCVTFIIFHRQGSIMPKHVAHISTNEWRNYITLHTKFCLAVNVVIIINILLIKYSNFATVFAGFLSYLCVILFRSICIIIFHSMSYYSFIWTEINFREINLHLRNASEQKNKREDERGASEKFRLLHKRRSLFTIFRPFQHVCHVLQYRLKIERTPKTNIAITWLVSHFHFRAVNYKISIQYVQSV
jgi:hypothetical protein